MEKVLVTGAAGFIGYHLSNKLLQQGFTVVGLDAINDYYDVNLKYGRLNNLGIDRQTIKYGETIKGTQNFTFYQLNLEDKEAMLDLFKKEKFDYVVNLAAQAGVRYSVVNPYAYIDSNISGFLNILEGCRHNEVKHLLYASTSSVYGLNEDTPFSVEDNVDHPISLYAATKKANELMAHTYAYLYKVPVTGLRFFTVYGPWGRPDMALFIFTKAILEGKPIDVYNHGKMSRDFTYVADIVEGISRLISKIPKGDPKFSGMVPNPSSSPAPYQLFNIGNNSPVQLMDFISAIEDETGKTAVKNFLPLQPGDVPATYADVTSLHEITKFKPQTSIQEGIKEFLKWYRSYYKL